MSREKNIEEILNEKTTLKDVSKSFCKEMKHNIRFETICILACETGEWGTEILAYLSELPFQNELGLMGGITLGGSYALYHVYKHAKEHGSDNVSLIDAAAYAGTTESGCIIGATGTEYLAGKFIAVTNNPLDLNNTVVRGGALIPAFGIGLSLMSAFTYVKKNEAARGIGKKGILKELKPDMKHSLKENKLEIIGKNSKLTIKEKRLPKTYQKDFKKEENSLYLLKSRIIRVKPEYSHDIEEYCEDLFKNAGHEINFVENIYSCSEHSCCDGE